MTVKGNRRPTSPAASELTIRPHLAIATTAWPAVCAGQDSVNGVNYDQRKQWIVSRLRFLSYIYAIDIAAYAVMSNHYHVVLHVDRESRKGIQGSGVEVECRFIHHREGLQ